MDAHKDTDPDVLAALRACRLWHAADDDAVSRLAAAAVVEHFKRGAHVATAGDTAERVGVVVAGRARIFHLAADGREITFEVADRGEAIGAIAALAGARYPANIEAATALSVAWVPAEAVFDLLAAQPEVARSMVTDLATRVADFTTVAVTLSASVPSRLAAYLFQRSLSVGKAVPDGLLVDLGMSKTELASALGTVPETLSRALAKLRDDGLIDVRSRDVIVHDVGALARLGSGYSEG